MSSNRASSAQLQAWLFLIVSLALTMWYGRQQILYSLSFVYDIAKLLFPEIVPGLIRP